MPITDFKKDEFILYPNYFGICSKNVTKLASRYSNLVVDNAHAFFDKPEGFACFNSAYKFNLGDFSYLWIKNDSNENEFLSDFEDKKNRRINKFMELNTNYSSSNLLKIDTNSIPFCYPFLAQSVKEADTLVKELKSEGLTIYRYWNSLPKSFNEYKFYSRLVPIPIIV